MNTEDAPQASGSVPASVAPCSHSTEAIESCAVRATVSTLDGGPDAPAGISANQDKALPPVRGPSLGRSVGGPTMDDVYASIMQKVGSFLHPRASTAHFMATLRDPHGMHGRHSLHSSPCMAIMVSMLQGNTLVLHAARLWGPASCCPASSRRNPKCLAEQQSLCPASPAEIPRVPPTALAATLHHPGDGDLARWRRGSHRGGRQPPQRGIVRGRRCCRR